MQDNEETGQLVSLRHRNVAALQDEHYHVPNFQQSALLLQTRRRVQDKLAKIIQETQYDENLGEVDKTHVH
jgi:transposase